MPASDSSKLNVEEFAERFRGEMVPISNTFAYFFAAMNLSDDEIKEYLEDPIAALPPSIPAYLPKVSVILVPYLERTGGRERSNGSASLVALEPPPESRASTEVTLKGGSQTVLVFAVKDQEMADYHYRFYHAIAGLVSERRTDEAESRFATVLREELSANVHGEVDEESWRLKQALIRRSSNVRRETKAFREYAIQSFIDTLTLYLHGICCDIDVETGPRQLPSRYLRKRLQVLHSLYPPPQGYAVFPEELAHVE
jgi:hypothetical protein